MRTAFGLVLLSVGALVGTASFMLVLLWWRTADVVRALRLD